LQQEATVNADEDEEPAASGEEDQAEVGGASPMQVDPPLHPPASTDTPEGLDRIKHLLLAFSKATRDGVMPSNEAWKLIADAIVETLKSLDILKRFAFVSSLISVLEDKTKEAKIVHANTLATVFLLSKGDEVTTSDDENAKMFYAPNGGSVLVDVKLVSIFLF
jgi:hypothetical protein